MCKLDLDSALNYIVYELSMLFELAFLKKEPWLQASSGSYRAPVQKKSVGAKFSYYIYRGANRLRGIRDDLLKS